MKDMIFRRILFDNEAGNPDDQIRYSIEVKNDELILAVDAFDGPSSIYKKVM